MGSQMISLYDHQQKTRDFSLARDIVFDASDPGTGKTIANLAAYNERRLAKKAGRLLVVCPKSIMELAWGRDIQRAFPSLTYTIAHAQNRVDAFERKSDVVIINHDGMTWLKNYPKYLEGFTDLIIDESTAFKHRTSGRSKAMANIAERTQWAHKTLLTGTPIPNTVTDIWHQVKLLDGGVRLGKNFHAFQSATCDAKQVGPQTTHLRWVDKEGINDVVISLLDDILIRHKLEECIDIPPNYVIDMPVPLDRTHRTQYEALKREAVLMLETGTISAFHAGSLRTKLLQLLSGAVYDENEGYQLINTSRYELVLELVEQRKASLVAFNWRHQRDEISRLANARSMEFGIIDGETPRIDRVRIVDAFQRGELKFILGHPQTMAHGITLTHGVATIWPSPTDNAEHFIQMNRRVYRNGQTSPTETILISAAGTIEEGVYDRLQGKVSKQQELLGLIELLDNSPNAAQNPFTTTGTPA